MQLAGVPTAAATAAAGNPLQSTGHGALPIEPPLRRPGAQGGVPGGGRPRARPGRGDQGSRWEAGGLASPPSR